MFWPCETRTSTCRSFATISSGLYRFLAIAVLLDVRDIPQVGPLQWGWINRVAEIDVSRRALHRERGAAGGDRSIAVLQRVRITTIVEKEAEAAIPRRRYVGAAHCYAAAILQKAARTVDDEDRAPRHHDARAIGGIHTCIPAASCDVDGHIVCGDQAPGPGRPKSILTAADALNGNAAPCKRHLTACIGVSTNISA